MKAIHFTTVCDAFLEGVSIGMCYNTGVLSQIPEFMPQFQNEQYLDQFFKFMWYGFFALTLMDLKFKFNPRERQIEVLG